jgi:hypothetical protein
MNFSITRSFLKQLNRPNSSLIVPVESTHADATGLLHDTHRTISGLQQAGFTRSQAAAISSAAHRIATHHLTHARSLLTRRSTLERDLAALSAGHQDLHLALQALSNRNTLEQRALHDTTAASVHALLEQLRDGCVGTRTELAMLANALKPELQGEAAGLELAVAKEEAAVGPLMGEVRTGLERGKTTAIAVFVASLASVFFLISIVWKQRRSASQPIKPLAS